MLNQILPELLHQTASLQPPRTVAMLLALADPDNCASRAPPTSFSGIGTPQNAKLAESPPAISRLSGNQLAQTTRVPGIDIAETPDRGESTGPLSAAKQAELTQLYTQQRLSTGRHLYASGSVFMPFRLPAGAVLRPSARGKAGAAGVSALAGGGGQSAMMDAAQQAMGQFMPPAAPALPGAAQLPAGPQGLVKGNPGAVPGHSAIKSVIQTQGPISASGDFGNPNAGQGVSTGMGLGMGGGMKMSKWRLRRLLLGFGT